MLGRRDARTLVHHQSLRADRLLAVIIVFYLKMIPSHMNLLLLVTYLSHKECQTPEFYEHALFPLIRQSAEEMPLNVKHGCAQHLEHD